MHHLSMPVSVCMRMKERRVVDMALGDRAAGSSWRDLVPVGLEGLLWMPLQGHIQKELSGALSARACFLRTIT